MATQTKGNIVKPRFKDVDKTTAAQAAATLASGGSRGPLVVPDDARLSVDNKGRKYARWTDAVTITTAEQGVSTTGLLEVKVVAKIRQSETKENNGRLVFSRFYWNTSEDVPESHLAMNERTIGAIVSLLTAAGLMPATGGLRAALLDKMFPEKGAKGAVSLLVGKSVIANIVQKEEEQKDKKTKKTVTDEDGNPILAPRDSAESFLPEIAVDSEGEDE